MKDKDMIEAAKNATEQSRKLENLPDEEIDLTDIPEIKSWSGAERGRFYRPVKKQITLRLDADMLDWFRGKGKRYQTRMNQVLREYMETHS